MTFILCMTYVDLCMAYLLKPFDLDLDTRSQWVGERQTFSIELSRQLSMQATSITLATTEDHYLRDLDFANVYMGLTILNFFIGFKSSLA